jgi:hypothetical protein
MYLTRNNMNQINNKLTNNILTNKKQHISNNNQEEIIQCLICWEQATKENTIHKMKHITLFISNCYCDCNVHLYCFFDWVKKTPSCPICRLPLTFNYEMYQLFTLGPHYKIKLFFKKFFVWINDIIIIIIKCATILFLLRVSINIINIILTKYDNI